MPAAEWIALAAASPRAQNSTAAPVAPAAAAAAYDMIVPLLTAIAAGLFAVLAAAIIQIARDEGRGGAGGVGRRERSRSSWR